MWTKYLFFVVIHKLLVISNHVVQNSLNRMLGFVGTFSKPYPNVQFSNKKAQQKWTY